MKTSIAISVQETEFGAIAKGNALDLIGRAKSAGYDSVELAVRDPHAVDAAGLVAVLAGTPVSAIGTGQAFLADGLSLTDADPTVRNAAIERLSAHCKLAADLSCPIVVVGLIRGRSGPYEYLVEGLSQVCASAWTMGISLVVEPLNRYECEIVATAAQGMELIDKVGADNLGLLLDTFHMNIEEPNPAAAFVASRERLWHVHFADSNRLAPGLGHLDFRGVVGLLRAFGYEGYISAEIMPKPDAVTSMAMALEHIRWALRASA